MNKTESDIIYSSVVGKNEPIIKEAALLKSGEQLVLDNNTVMHNKHLSFTCDVNGELEGIVRIGHGKDCYASSYLEVSKTHMRVFHHYVALGQYGKREHDLTIKDYLTVNIDVKYSVANITLMTSSGMCRLDGISWSGRQGDIFAEAVDTEISNVRMSWSSDDYKKQIHLYGDSYFNTKDQSRWPYYLCNDGYMNGFMTGYPGMACARAIVDFRLTVERSNPKYAVWCMGMNNGDSADAINEDYLSTTTEFLATCKERGIIPILSTIPTTPIINNNLKNEWVRSQGVRYIDFARAVGGNRYDESLVGKEYNHPNGSVVKNITGCEWYPGMLYADQVHPDKKGAQALYMQLLADFPEIMQK